MCFLCFSSFFYLFDGFGCRAEGVWEPAEGLRLREHTLNRPKARLGSLGGGSNCGRHLTPSHIRTSPALEVVSPSSRHVAALSADFLTFHLVARGAVWAEAAT